VNYSTQFSLHITDKFGMKQRWNFCLISLPPSFYLPTSSSAISFTWLDKEVLTSTITLWCMWVYYWLLQMPHETFVERSVETHGRFMTLSQELSGKLDTKVLAQKKKSPNVCWRLLVFVLLWLGLRLYFIGSEDSWHVYYRTRHGWRQSL